MCLRLFIALSLLSSSLVWAGGAAHIDCEPLFVAKDLSLPTLQARFNEAIKQGKDDVEIEEFRDEAIWMSAKLPAMIATVRQTIESPGFRKEWEALVASRRYSKTYEQMLTDAEVYFKITREEVDLAATSLKFYYKRWYLAANAFVRLADLSSDVQVQKGEYLLFLIELQNRVWDLKLDLLYNSKILIDESLSPNGWRSIPTVRSHALREINEWMSRGFTPVKSIAEHEAYDDTTKERGSPQNNRNHDEAHAGSYPAYATGLKVTPHELYEHFFAESRNSPDPLLTEALWAFVMHEVIWSYGTKGSLARYGADAILKLASSEKARFASLMKRGFFDEWMQGRRPDEAQSHKTIEWLTDFAKRVESTYGPFEIERP